MPDNPIVLDGHVEGEKDEATDTGKTEFKGTANTSNKMDNRGTKQEGSTNEPVDAKSTQK